MSRDDDGDTDRTEQAAPSRLSRRRLLGGTGAVAAGGVGLLAETLATAGPAAAANPALFLNQANAGNAGQWTDLHSDPTGAGNSTFVVRNLNAAGSNGIAVLAGLGPASGILSSDGGNSAVLGDSEHGLGVSGFSNANIGVSGQSWNSAGVQGTGVTGVQGVSYERGGYGVFGQSSDIEGYEVGVVGTGVYGESSEGVGVHGKALGSRGNSLSNPPPSSADGVLGESAFGIGVHGKGGGTSAGVYGESAKGAGVYGFASANDGVYGQSTTSPGTHGVSASGPGVRAISTSGPGLIGISTSNYGVQAQGGLAPLRLVPATKAGKPTTGAHQVGELYLDSVAALYLCTKAGTPGTWAKVSAA